MTRPLWRLGNRLETRLLRTLGTSPMAAVNRGGVLVIETTGRRSGRARFTPVGYLQNAGGAYVVGGGAAGMVRTPDWVANLRAEPAAAVWVKRRRIAVVASELSGDERDEAREHALAVWPGVETYERRSGRVVPYFRLTPRPEDAVTTTDRRR